LHIYEISGFNLLLMGNGYYLGGVQNCPNKRIL